MNLPRVAWLASGIALVVIASCTETTDSPPTAATGVVSTAAVDTTPRSLPDVSATERSDIGLGWEAVAIPPPVAALCHRATVTTDTEVVLWGGNRESCDYEVPAGDPALAYRPDTGDWRQLSPSPLDPVVAPTGVWTGSEVIICCGMASGQAAAYDRERDTWRHLADPPVSGPFPNALWTGHEMIVVTEHGVAAYQPSSDSWRRLPDPPQPLGRINRAVWTGEEVIVWPVWTTGPVQRQVHRGLALDPETDTWNALPDPPVWPAALDMVFTGDSLIIWGGLPAESGGSERAVGSRYDLAAGTWAALSESLPEPDGCECNLGSQTLTWTGEYVLVSPGWLSSGVDPDTPVLLAYHPATGTWLLVASDSPLAWGGTSLKVGERLLIVVNDAIYVSPADWQPEGQPITSESWDD